MTQKTTLYAVYKDGETKASGSLLDCWRWVMVEYADQLSTYPLHLAHDLAESGVMIAPVGQQHAQAA